MNLTADRRALHRIPELERELPKTMAYLQSALKSLNCAIFSPMEGALCAWFDFGQPSAIAFRADADALPITEATGKEYASEHPGWMHACGHDGHMAIVLELARRLSRIDSLPHNVLLVFQPAEETTGGAKDLCETGIFSDYRVEAIFGLHLWPGLEAGVIASRTPELMARACEVDIDIYGKSSHIAKAAQGIDALAAGAELYRRAAALEQSLPPEVFRLLKFGKFQSGTVRNALSAHTRMEGCLRAFQDSVFEYLRQELDQAAREVQEASGCTVRIHYSSGYPAVMNPPELFARIQELYPLRVLEEPSMTSEDFSWYQRYLPGMFFFLGLGEVPPLHSGHFDFDEALLEQGVSLFETIALSF